LADNVITFGAYAALILPGTGFGNVAVLEKEALRSSDTLWILSAENTLEIRKVKNGAQNRP
jgi:hypothetical protein